MRRWMKVLEMDLSSPSSLSGLFTAAWPKRRPDKTVADCGIWCYSYRSVCHGRQTEHGLIQEGARNEISVFESRKVARRIARDIVLHGLDRTRHSAGTHLGQGWRGLGAISEIQGQAAEY